MRKLKGIILAFLALATAAVVYALSKPARQVPAHPYFENHGVRVIAHRGGRGLWPENTLYGFRRATELGVDILELDIRATADGVLVAHHDSEVDRTTEGQGPVADLTLEQLGALDAGYTWTNDGGATFPYRGMRIRVPTLEDVFSAFPGARFAIEIKPPSTEVAISLCRTVGDLGMADKVLVASFHQETMATFRESCPSVATGATPREALFFYQLNRFRLDFLLEPKAEALQVMQKLGDIDVITPRFLNAARKLNIRVHVWTVNDVDDMKRLIGLGVDGIMTDYPDRLMKVLGRYPHPTLSQGVKENGRHFLGPIHREGDDII